MKFQRINEDTIRCIVNSEDMQEYGIAFEDFFKNKGKVNDFLHEVVERAREEVGYTPKDGMLSMQIIPISPNKLSITFSEGEAGGYKSLLESLKSGLEESLGADLLDALDEDTDEYEQDENFLESEKNTQQNLGMLNSKMVMIGMSDINQMAEFCRVLDINKTVTSQLYFVENQGIYSLIVEKNRLSTADMKQMLILAIEYTSIITDDEKVISHIREYGEEIINKSAYRILKSYV